jgi:inosine-uridine nucleoside N-ribohydrolase
MNGRPFIIDVGPSDASLALRAAALAPALDIVGITAFDGACWAAVLEKTRFLCLVPSASLPVAVGGGRLLRNAAAGDGCVPAHAFIYDQALRLGGSLELLALGPLSNIAKAILARPDVVSHIKRIYVAGGAHAGGDTTPAAERSIHADAEAAKIVFESGIPIVMVGLDVEGKARLSFDEARAILDGDSALLDSLANAPDERRRGFVPALGLAALLSALDEGIATFKECHVDIETRGELTYGKTVCDVDNPSRGKLNAKVALGLDHDCFVDHARRLFA